MVIFNIDNNLFAHSIHICIFMCSTGNYDVNIKFGGVEIPGGQFIVEVRGSISSLIIMPLSPMSHGKTNSIIKVKV